MELDESSGVKLKVVSSSICGSDLHMMKMNFLEGRVPGHEFAGIASNGKAYSVEPVMGCGSCSACDEGQLSHCHRGAQIFGVMKDGGMAEYVMVPESTLVELPTGIDITHACLAEPLSIALHGLDRLGELGTKPHCLIIGGGPIGLGAAAAALGRGIKCDLLARYEHQAVAAEALGASAHLDANKIGEYAVVIDAVGSTDSLNQATQHCQTLGRICMLGTPWEGTQINAGLQMKEINLVMATGYQCKQPNRTFEEANSLLHRRPEIGNTIITHQFALEAATEAFDVAASRAEGAIKVVFG